MYSTHPIIKINNEVGHPSKEIIVGKHIFVVDSRQRDCNIFPSPNRYQIPIGQIFKNITQIELKGAILPKCSYNVHSSNKYIDFNIGDGVTRIDVLNGGSGYTSVPDVTISSPVAGGTQATATAVIQSGSVVAININISGSGYIQSKSPIISVEEPPSSGYSLCAQAEIFIGVGYSAELRDGNYTLGGNPDPAISQIPSGILKEIQNSMNHAVNGGNYDSMSTSPFVARVVSQYPELNATVGSPQASDTNSCLFNRIQITNVNSSPWELLFCTGHNKNRNSRRLLGYSWADNSTPTTTPQVLIPSGLLIPAGTTIRSSFDFDLMDYPDYVILSFCASSDNTFERVESKPGYGLNRSFATLSFDANVPENLKGLAGTDVENVADINYLVGNISKGPFYVPQGTTKPLKGNDFDQKILSFKPPLGKLSNLNIEFNKFGTSGGGVPELYDFQGRDHLLIFEFSSQDTNSSNIW